MHVCCGFDEGTDGGWEGLEAGTRQLGGTWEPGTMQRPSQMSRAALPTTTLLGALLRCYAFFGLGPTACAVSFNPLSSVGPFHIGDASDGAPTCAHLAED